MNNMRVIEVLLQNGAKVDKKNNNNETPLHYAIKENNSKMIELLLQHGANVDEMNGDNETPLHYALRMNGNRKIVELLLQKGANVQLKNKQDKTPKDIVIEQKDLELIVMVHEAEKKSLNKPKAKMDDDCIICFNPKRGIFAFLPCGHAMTCENCSKSTIASSDKPECPTCRQPVTIYQKIFL